MFYSGAVFNMVTSWEEGLELELGHQLGHVGVGFLPHTRAMQIRSPGCSKLPMGVNGCSFLCKPRDSVGLKSAGIDSNFPTIPNGKAVYIMDG